MLDEIFRHFSVLMQDICLVLLAVRAPSVCRPVFGWCICLTCNHFIFWS